MSQQLHPGFVYQENENTNSKKYMHPNIHEALFTVAKT